MHILIYSNHLQLEKTENFDTIVKISGSLSHKRRGKSTSVVSNSEYLKKVKKENSRVKRNSQGLQLHLVKILPLRYPFFFYCTHISLTHNQTLEGVPFKLDLIGNSTQNL